MQYSVMLWAHRSERSIRLFARWLRFRLIRPKPYTFDIPEVTACGDEKTLILFFPTDVFNEIPLREHLKYAEIPPDFEISNNLNRLHEASAIVFHVPDILTLEGIPKLPGQVWVGWSGECPIHRRHQRFCDVFDLTMTYKTDADVFKPYFPTLAELRNPAVSKTPGALVSFFASNVIEFSGRTAYAASLMRLIRVDSYGKCLNNRKIKDDTGWDSKLDIMSRYKFDLSFENAIDDDYVTEKFFQPLIVGTVPIYLGASNIDRFAPGERCFINCNDFRDPRELAEYILHLDSNESEYEEFLAWKEKPFLADFDELYRRFEGNPFSQLFMIIQHRLDKESGKNRR